jgi:MoaA/NifB/PqqE/SkfB family radical SAM enzyme
VTSPAPALRDGTVGGRLWLYSNYHCNLVCTYCLTESGPKVARRTLDPATMLDLAQEARDLGFTGIGVTGGEPFLVPDMPELLVRLSRVLPVLVLTNGTLFSRALLESMAPLAQARVTLQISLDHPDPEANDVMRGPENFHKVVEAVPALVQRGITVRIATTLEEEDAEDLARLCALHRGLGVSDDDHVVRPVLRRGRAETEEMGVVARYLDLEPELTVTADGAFWSPFGPTVTRGVLDTDLLLTRTVRPLQRPLDAMLTVVGARPEGADSALNIR